MSKLSIACIAELKSNRITKQQQQNKINTSKKQLLAACHPIASSNATLTLRETETFGLSTQLFHYIFKM